MERFKLSFKTQVGLVIAVLLFIAHQQWVIKKYDDLVEEQDKLLDIFFNHKVVKVKR